MWLLFACVFICFFFFACVFTQVVGILEAVACRGKRQAIEPDIYNGSWHPDPEKGLKDNFGRRAFKSRS